MTVQSSEYQRPSRNKKVSKATALNLIPILDGIFILIFFLLITSNFSGTFQVESSAPVISSTPPEEEEKSLNLELHLGKERIQIFTAETTRSLRKEIAVSLSSTSKEHLISLHEALVSLKKDFPKDKTAILFPEANLSTQELIAYIDEIRHLNPTDEAIFYKEKGLDQKATFLFPNLVFGNLQ